MASHQLKWLSSKSLQTRNAKEHVERIGNSPMVGMYSHYKEEYIGSLKKKKHRSTYDPVIQLLGVYTREKHNLKRYLHSGVHCSAI